MAEGQRSLWDRVKTVLKPIQAVGLAITRFINLVLVGLVYFLAVGPLSLILRVTGKKLLESPQSSDSSYWVDRTQPIAELDKFQRQF